MKYYYLLISLFVLVHFRALPQSDVYYASRTNAGLYPEGSKQSLKQSLRDLERSFGVSIAYKDEWVEGQKVRGDMADFETVEDALNELFKGTGLFYEKAGERFYVIYERGNNLVRTGANQSITRLLPPLLATGAGAGLINLPKAIHSYIAASQFVVSGIVRDENNSPFPGVNILIKGTTTGTSTDVNGRYSLDVENGDAILVFSFVGYTTQEIAVGGRTIIDLSMTPDIKALDELVVTALGIEKSSRGLGYSTTKVNADELVVNRTPNLMNSLQGKIAGVNVSSLGTGPGGTSKIRIRGQSSISGQNNPLIVINGVPIDNTNFGTNPNNLASDNSIGVRGGGITSDGGDGLLSINPDDIESMTVLKGATAAALYGSRAKDGVIMITTKTRGEGQGIGIVYNLNYTNDQPLDFTDYQYEYGQGENGVRPTTPNPTSGQWSFGERFQPGMTHVLFDGVEVPYVPQPGFVDKFFRHGQTVTNTISLSSGGEKGGFNLSMADMSSKGIVPNNSYTRRTVNLGFNYSLSDKVSFKGSINYSNEFNKNAPNVGNQDNTIPVALYNMANSMPLDLLNEKKYNAAGNEFIYSRFMNRTNPYFTLADQFNNIRRDRIFGNVSIRYDILSWLFVQGRIGQDYWSRDQDYNNFPTGQASRPAAPAGFVNGMFTQEARRFREVNADFLVSGTRQFGDFNANLTVGGNQMYRRSDLNSVQVTDFVVRDLYTVQNGRVKDPLYDLSERKVNSLYGSAEISYKEFLYLSGTLRNDWFSTLSPENRSILYPSVSAGYIFTESFGTLPSWLSYGKLRVAYAEVGSDSDVGPYSNILFYGINSNLFSNPSGAPQPVGGPSGTTVPNPDLKPMRIAETEVGLELRFLNNRLGIDVAAYQKTTTDQIVQAQISDASGFVDTRINSGESRNRGIEFLINIVPVETPNFRWNFVFNGSYNKTKVLSLLTATPGERITVGTHLFNGELRQIVGEEMGQIAGFGYLRDSEGRKVFGTNGIALATPALVNFGGALPDWVGGFTNSFNYKGISFSFLIDFKLGGKMISGTNFNATRHGLHKMTLEGRESGVIGDGVNEEGEINDVVVFPVQPFWEVVRSKGLVEPVVYDAGYWKLRQITVGYDFTRFLPEGFPVKGVRLSLVANNVAMLKKWVPNIDPESFGYTSDNLVGLESTGLPTTRSIGFNLNVKL
jgi:TonB-linked SusC/RagA family outer membrane protein